MASMRTTPQTLLAARTVLCALAPPGCRVTFCYCSSLALRTGLPAFSEFSEHAVTSELQHWMSPPLGITSPGHVCGSVLTFPPADRPHPQRRRPCSPGRRFYQSCPEMALCPLFLLYFSSWHLGLPDIVIYRGCPKHIHIVRDASMRDFSKLN